MPTTPSKVVALGLLLTACSVAAVPTTTTVATTTTTTTTTTLQTTTTTAPSTLSPVTGLPVDDPALLDRRLLAVKIDNHPRANPQSGIDQADMVIEMLVEGVTRYLTLWQESDAEYLGPMRSARPTDTTLLMALNQPTYARSGSQEWVAAVAVQNGIHLIGEVGQPATFRISGRFAPHNLYVNTIELRNVADSRGHPDEPPAGSLWTFGPMPADATPVSSVTMRFGGNQTRWDWDPGTGMWLRTAYGEESIAVDQEGNETRIGIPILMVLYVDQYTAMPPPGWGGGGLPSSQTVGSGFAYVFAEGKVVEGSWERADETVWFTLTRAGGQRLMVPPGKIWVSLVPASGGITYEP
ncbi:MAG: DUF3048 domain-containing protein [Actinobacteria bacterium]|nr:DUF3048 domain-containing protein [Actinomycetota bacterium]MCI0677426.1 DUF3048 domain-containing protein [Actinomycetota bacterium]